MNTVTLPIQLTVEQLIEAVLQLEPASRAQVAQALVQTKLDSELTVLIQSLYDDTPVTDISEEEILAEIQAVRQGHQ